MSECSFTYTALLDTLSSGFFFVCFDEGLRTIGTIMETRDWTLSALYLVDSSDSRLENYKWM
ncbi:hypothetical protein GIB67_029101 [Kingdonia uniflora]|uniref:Uncharacterized protein n=1 Tax=Kingdonia uniflora TaxID=39325 RepID=A0A7J7N706_9MAGN|nr:hypothetical protein GIB67_029101 [Kingdonia uniflora]